MSLSVNLPTFRLETPSMHARKSEPALRRDFLGNSLEKDEFVHMRRTYLSGPDPTVRRTRIRETPAASRLPAILRGRRPPPELRAGRQGARPHRRPHPHAGEPSRRRALRAKAPRRVPQPPRSRVLRGGPAPAPPRSSAPPPGTESTARLRRAAPPGPEAPRGPPRGRSRLAGGSERAHPGTPARGPSAPGTPPRSGHCASGTAIRAHRRHAATKTPRPDAPPPPAAVTSGGRRAARCRARHRRCRPRGASS